MKQGLRIRDESGNVTLDSSTRNQKKLGTFTVPSGFSGYFSYEVTAPDGIDFTKNTPFCHSAKPAYREIITMYLNGNVRDVGYVSTFGIAFAPYYLGIQVLSPSKAVFYIEFYRYSNAWDLEMVYGVC